MAKAKRASSITITSAEQLVIDRAIAVIQQEELIEYVAECAAQIQKQESSVLPILNEQLKEINKGIENMLNAIQMGIITPSTKERLDSLEEEKKKLETAILSEKLIHPEIPKEYFLEWLKRLQSKKTDDAEYRKMIADAFINSVYWTDVGLTFGLNFIDGVETIPLREWNQGKGSDLLGCAPLRILHFSAGFFILFIYLPFAQIHSAPQEWKSPRYASPRRPHLTIPARMGIMICTN